MSGRGKQQALARRLEREAREEVRGEIIEEMAKGDDGCICRFARCDPRPMVGQINFRIPDKHCGVHFPRPKSPIAPEYLEAIRATARRLGLLP